MIEFKNVVKEYVKSGNVKVRILDGINLSIGEKEMVALLGANGSGKSTLLKCLCGVIKPTEGEITVDGKDTFKNRKQLIKNMGVIFNQKPSFIVDLSVSDNLKYFQSIYGISSSNFKKTLFFLDDYLHVSELFEKPYRKLSFGERVKCELVSILLHDPQYIYMDEPTIGLDYIAKKGLYDLVAELKRMEKTIIIITHEVDYIEGVCNRVVILRDGCVCYDNSPKRIMDRLGKQRKMIVKYERIFDEEKAKKVEETYLLKKYENELTVFLNDEKDMGKIISELAEAFAIKSVQIERNSVREILENVLRETI